MRPRTLVLLQKAYHICNDIDQGHARDGGEIRDAAELIREAVLVVAREEFGSTPNVKHCGSCVWRDISLRSSECEPCSRTWERPNYKPEIFRVGPELP